MSQHNRRQFLKRTVATGAAFTLPTTFSFLHAQSPNERINLGVIGCGWRGGQLLEAFSKVPGVNIAGICDADQALVGESSAKYPSAKTWVDMRGMLDDTGIDAVAIATCNHWHCLASIRALEAGKHVYVEKPLAHAHWEGEQLVRAVKKYNRICQVGTQQRSDPMQAEIKDFLHGEQALGKIHWVRANRYGIREPIGRRSTPLKVPETVDYNLWLGPAADQPIFRDKLHYDWHWVWNTGSGEMGNWGIHIIDDVRDNVFRDEVALPRRVVAAGGRFGWDDAGNTPNVHFAILDTGSVPVVIALTNLPKEPGSDKSPDRPGPESGYVVYCEGGRLEGQRGRAAAFDADGRRIKRFRGDEGSGHQGNFIESVRNGDPSALNTPAQVGHHSTAWCNFANIAYRTAAMSKSRTDPRGRLAGEFGGDSPGIEVFEEMTRTLAKSLGDGTSGTLVLGPVLEFDDQAGRFVGDVGGQANQFLRREDRAGFEVPDLSAS